ncbi:MAG: hypothetical protein QXP53_01090 [Candidatus Pacearchaeota archaeon]
MNKEIKNKLEDRFEVYEIIDTSRNKKFKVFGKVKFEDKQYVHIVDQGGSGYTYFKECVKLK